MAGREHLVHGREFRGSEAQAPFLGRADATRFRRTMQHLLTQRTSACSEHMLCPSLAYFRSSQAGHLHSRACIPQHIPTV
jgi:hypothetical protein